MPKHQHTTRWEKLFVAVIALFVVFGVNALGIPVAHAQASLDPATQATLNGAIVMMGILITGMNFLMWILFWMLNIVSNPDFIFEPAMVQMLWQIWVFCRDVTNLLFAFLLIAGAIMATVTRNTETVKTLMPKFVTAVILVNFSWFIPRVIYDASSVLAYTVYQIPTMFRGNECTIPKTTGPGREPCKYVTDIAFLEDATANLSTGVGGWECQLKPLVCIKLANMDDNFTATNQGRQTILYNGLIVNYARLRTLVYVVDPRPIDPGAPLNISSLLTTLVKFGVILVLHVALFFPILAMVAAFFIRIPVLWLTMAFMPFVALGYVIGDKMGNWNPVEKIGKQFIRAAFLPAFVGVPFAVGYVLISAGSKMAAPASIAPLMRPLPIFMGVSDFWQLFWMMLSLGVLWTGVFAVLKSDDFMGHFTESIKGTGEALGKFALKAPLAAPIIPTPSGGNMSPLQVGKALNPKTLLASLEQTGSLADTFKGKADTPLQISQKMDSTILVRLEDGRNGGDIGKIIDGSKTGADAKTALNNAFGQLKANPTMKGRNYSNKEMLDAYIENRKARGLPALKPEELKRLQDSL